MTNKGIITIGSSIALVPSIGSIGYFVISPLQRTFSKDIDQLIKERRCFEVISGTIKDKQVNHFLLSCLSRTNNKDLAFYYYQKSSKVAIPIRSLSVSREKEIKGRGITLNFYWNNPSTISVTRHTDGISWLNRDGSNSYLKDFCKNTNLAFYRFGYGDSTTLICQWGADKNNQRELWREFKNF
ncbi:hypothetical protein WEN_01840 [Mycoplasma wenyonii str. Massachusetts]|uniref:Uncharacterized protein n=1 Tax=Mycoplasma wenyonii (strain Massachusetts) TaxID=1197325 RepID=I6YB15_MYCWM|nr:hypothetical protein [Mycoplasma wenyonii]AFN65161.1 hypothetical protein WEN_01840 [Mycoplasma wenyonii str. Massachusetts]